MHVRPAEPSDLDALAAMRVALWPDGTREEHRADAAAIVAGRPRSTLPLVILVAESAGAVVGFVEVGLRSHAEGCDGTRPVGYLEGWWVEPSHRRSGVGRALVAAAEDWARSRGSTEMASDTWLGADDAVRAHQALGYEAIERAICFRKALDTSATQAKKSRDDGGGAG